MDKFSKVLANHVISMLALSRPNQVSVAPSNAEFELYDDTLWTICGDMYHNPSTIVPRATTALERRQPLPTPATNIAVVSETPAVVSVTTRSGRRGTRVQPACKYRRLAAASVLKD